VIDEDARQPVTMAAGTSRPVTLVIDAHGGRMRLGASILNVPVSMRCPRCKQPLEADDRDVLADDMVAHLRDVHGHEPPREHVLARIARQIDDADGR
jgi:predicted small metal-binding protein